MSTERVLGFPEEWYAKPIRLAEQDSEPDNSQEEIERLSALAAEIQGRSRRDR